jgi:hypothetical protein
MRPKHPVQEFARRLRSFRNTARLQPSGRRRIEHLETRTLLTIAFVAETGLLRITGDDTANFGSISIQEPNILRVSLDEAVREFSIDSVISIVFHGECGDDTFLNSSPIPSILIGCPGKDTLSGGSGNDMLAGAGGG